MMRVVKVTTLKRRRNYTLCISKIDFKFPASQQTFEKVWFFLQANAVWAEFLFAAPSCIFFVKTYDAHILA